VLRPLLLAAALVIAAALFGAATVFLALENKAVIVTHLAIAMSLLGTLVVAIVRAGGPPQIQKYDALQLSPSSFERAPDHSSAAAASGTSRASIRSAYTATALTFITLVLGALTAHVPGANSACAGFPLCSGGILPTDSSQHLQLTHRLIAYALFFHVLGMSFSTRRRGELLLARLTLVALVALLAQIAVAATMVVLQLPALWRSLHEAVGTLAWVVICFLTYSAHLRSAGHARRTAQSDATSPLPGGARA
jgi:heme A synthase